MGAGDAPRSDVERLRPVRRSAWGVDQCGSRWRPKPGPLKCPRRRRRRDRGLQRAPSKRTWKLKSAKECVTTHLSNQLAPKMDGAEARDLYLAVGASARPR